MRTTHGLIALALGASLAFPCATAQAQDKDIPSRHQVLREAFRDVAAKTKGNVVKLKSGGNHLGYGVVIGDGYLLTCSSVVKEGAVSVLGAGFSGSARVVNHDHRNGIALLKGEGSLPGGASFGSSKALFVGQYVISVGLGDEPLAVGCVSAKDRRVTSRGKRGPSNFLAELFGQGGKQGPERDYMNIIQHDSKLPKKNYGSPVFNADGQLVGINVEKAYRGSSYFVGIDQIRGVLKALKAGKPRTQKKAAAKRGFLGVSVRAIENKAQLKKLGVAFAFEITEIYKGSGAATAGVLVGDVLTGLGGDKVGSFEELAARLGRAKVGEQIILTVVRKGKSMDFKCQLGERP